MFMNPRFNLLFLNILGEIFFQNKVFNEIYGYPNIFLLHFLYIKDTTSCYHTLLNYYLYPFSISYDRILLCDRVLIHKISKTITKSTYHYKICKLYTTHNG